jgi:hypothetical protein
MPEVNIIDINKPVLAMSYSESDNNFNVKHAINKGITVLQHPHRQRYG